VKAYLEAARVVSLHTEYEAATHLRLLWTRRRHVCHLSACALLVSTAVAFLIPKRYESTARLISPPITLKLKAIPDIAADVSLDLPSTGDLFVGILNSRTVQDRLIQEFDLRKLYRVRLMEDARKDLAKHTAMSIDRKSQIISITVTDEQPERAAGMTQAYVDELNHLVAELSTSSAHRERIFLQDRLQVVNRELEAAEKELSQFASENMVIDPPVESTAMIDAAATLQGQLIGELSLYEGLRNIYADNDIRLRAAKASADEMRLQLKEMSSEDDSAKTAGLPSMTKLPLLGVTYANLERQITIHETVLQTLTAMYETAKLQEANEIPVVNVLEHATIPDKKSSPPRLFIIMLGTMLGITVSIGLMFARAAWSRMNPFDERRILALEVFTTAKSLLRFGNNGFPR
jgi:uncharacterized protein involved in exopolysaccharide biosynthesis